MSHQDYSVVPDYIGGGCGETIVCDHSYWYSGLSDVSVSLSLLVLTMLLVAHGRILLCLRSIESLDRNRHGDKQL